MKMNKLKEIFADKGIFAIFAENFANEFATLFQGISAAVADGFTMFRNGNKNVIADLTVKNKEVIVCNIIAMYVEQWKKTLAALTDNYQFGNVITRTKGGTIQREIDNTDTATNFEKVFNDTEQTDTDKNVSVKDGLQIDTYNTTETETKQMQIENVGKLVRLRRQNLQIEIVDTICNNLTIDIY